jgi:dihydrofolate synthase/folylpolyglutamate synthase
MQVKTLSEWVDYIASVHTADIALGLDRVSVVAERLSVLNPSCPVIMVAGTNGKGSCVAGLLAIYRAEGYLVAAFTSPYLIRLNEEFKVNGLEVSDADLCHAFASIEAVRGDTLLTVFEFKTLAALIIFKKADPDVMLLEVGLGGRLDAVNIINADVSVVTSIAIDHADRLGDTRELIGYEKAGIFRKDKPAVCGDFLPPLSVKNYANEVGTTLYCQGVDFSFQQKNSTWGWRSSTTHYENLPRPVLTLQNMSTVLMTVELLQKKLPVNRLAIDNAFKEVSLAGRIEIFPGDITQIFDVSHNPAAAELLAEKLKTLSCSGKTYAVFSMLADKDILGTLQVMKDVIDDWFVAPLGVKRGASIETLELALKKADIKNITSLADIPTAFDIALLNAKLGDRVVVFGSFYTVASSLKTANRISQ